MLELLLILRQSSVPVKSPAGFLRRAINENWTPETIAMKVNRRVENIEERFYIKKGYTDTEAREKVLNNRVEGW